MKKASCMMLATIGAMSRKRAQSMPRKRVAAKASSAKRARPGSARTASGPGRLPQASRTRATSGRLWAATMALRNTTRSACTV
jgi:DNA-binding protein H-NS